MFMDDINNRYTYLNSMKNVVHEEENAAVPRPGRTVVIDSNVEGVINRLLKERPTWRFKCKQRLYGEGTVAATDFYVFDGDEELGRLWGERHWRDGNARFYFSNFRIARDSRRSTAQYTSKPDLAAKRIVKAFHLKSPSERAVDMTNEVRTVVNEITGSCNWPFRRAKSAIEKELFSYAVNHWETIKPFLGSGAASIDLPALAEADSDAALLSIAVSSRDGVYVRIEANGCYFVVRHRGDSLYETDNYTDTTLPDHLRGSLGLLKLIADKGHVPGVGVRVNAKLYFVMDKKEQG
jgi:hypothetical protein